MKRIMISKEEGFLIDWVMCAHVKPEARFLGTVKRTVGICPLFQDCLIIDVSLVL